MSIQESRDFVIWRGEMAQRGWDLSNMFEDMNVLECTAYYRHEEGDKGLTIIKELFIKKSANEDSGLRVWVEDTPEDVLPANAHEGKMS